MGDHKLDLYAYMDLYANLLLAASRILSEAKLESESGKAYIEISHYRALYDAVKKIEKIGDLK